MSTSTPWPRLGLRVIGTAAERHHAGLRELGVEPLDHRDPDMAARVRELSPGGVDAVFDPVAGPGVRTSYALLGSGGKLVVYGNAAAVGTGRSVVWVFVKLLTRLYAWNALPNATGPASTTSGPASSPAAPRSAVACVPTSASSSTCCGRE
ncbi:zinc-binding dehydrogenase [Micromonospora sp. NPDC051227]|uniref:zinc-binding dehydrogenase n=1 Tax=Micromonospora sp. NPDC051227 TaxID=3364285 RepID=UPI0037A0387C